MVALMVVVESVFNIIRKRSRLYLLSLWVQCTNHERDDVVLDDGVGEIWLYIKIMEGMSWC